MMDKNEKTEITYAYTRLRKQFGKQPLFSDHGPELLDSFGTDASEFKHYILRNPVHKEIQNTKNFSENTVNTVRAEYTCSGINHTEGGWPKDINTADPEAMQRYRRKIEKDDAYLHCVMHLSGSMEHYILQNNAIDMYQTYYGELPKLPPVERSTCRTVNVFRDVGPRRPVTSLCWQTEGGQRLAATYADVDIHRNSKAINNSFIWDIENANAPETTLQPKYPLLDLQYNPRDSNTLAGALMSGQVAVWDARRGGDAALMCSPYVAHRELARSLLFINSKSGSEFFSSSPDGVVKWWDMRNMKEPTDSMIIHPVATVAEEQKMEKALGLSALEYEPTIPTRFMVGTENGKVIGANRKGKNAVEKLPFKFDAHSGPVYALQRNPAFLKNFLTVGDWTARIWSEDCKESAILWTAPHRVKLTDGTWNPIRFSLMLVSQWDGCLACWDLVRKQSQPVVTAQLCDEPLLRLKAHEAGRLVACGSQLGAVYLAELSPNLGQADKNDKLLLTSIFERENKRERILEARMREIRLKLRQEAESGAHAHAAAAAASEDAPAPADKDLQEATQDYLQIVQNESKPS